LHIWYILIQVVVRPLTPLAMLSLIVD